MTSADENAPSEPRPTDEEALAPATPGAEALPLPGDQVDKPSDD